MKNEVLDSIYYSVKNKPIGGVLGGISGYLLAKKVIKTSNIFAIVGVVIFGALIGSGVEYRLTEKK